MAHVDATRYNRVLFCHALGWAPLPGGLEGRCIDGSSLSFIVEELIARCAVRIVIPDSTVAHHFTDTLDPLLARRVETVPSEPVLRKVHALLAPITEEFPVRFTGASVDLAPEIKDKQLRDALPTLFFLLTEYLLAQHYRTQVDVSLDTLRGAVSTVRAYSRSPGSRAVLAALAGVLSVYTELESGALIAAPAASLDMVRLFSELVEDAGYLQASETAHWLGLPAKATRAAVLLRRSVQMIAARTPFKQLLTLGTRAVTAATQVPMPDCQALVEILGTGFLPPVVSLRDALQTALRDWERAGTQPVYPPCPLLKDFLAKSGKDRADAK
jgi:hypothetical protein